MNMIVVDPIRIGALITRLGIALLLMTGLFSNLAAQELPERMTLPLALASEAAQAALTACEKQGYRVSVAVVNHAGLLKVLLRGDGSGPHTIDSSSKKAYTSVSLGHSTSELVALIGDNPAAAGLRDMNEKILILGGGLPIKVGEEVIGGIGVGGAPGGEKDEACAQAGMAKIQGRLP